MRVRPALLSLIWLPALAAAWGQTPPLSFEVASIHATNPADPSGYIKAMPGGQQYVARNIPVKLMISLMYKVPMRQITGGPAWIESDRFDVDAKAERPSNIDDLHTMYQALLADRFKLRFHREPHEGPVYALVLDRAGVKMKPDTSPQDFQIPITFASDRVVGVRVPMNYLSWWLGQTLQADERPVIDQTGLTGNYDFTLRFQPVRPPGAATADNDARDDRPTLFDAVREQLGLRLEARRGPVESLVIDSIERPSDN